MELASSWLESGLGAMIRTSGISHTDYYSQRFVILWWSSNLDLVLPQWELRLDHLPSTQVAEDDRR